jgi:hypothetical protein
VYPQEAVETGIRPTQRTLLEVGINAIGRGSGSGQVAKFGREKQAKWSAREGENHFV